MALTLFAVTFLLVGLLGLQQLNVQGNHRPAAFLTSLLIGGANLAVLKLVPGPTGWLEVLGFLAGGPFGILASMAVHPWLVQWFGGETAADPEPARQTPTGPSSGSWLTLAGADASASVKVQPDDQDSLERAMQELERTVDALRRAGGGR